MADEEPAKETKERSPRSHGTRTATTGTGTYPRGDDVLRPSYRHLSTVPTAPTAPITPRREESPRRHNPNTGPGRYFKELPWGTDRAPTIKAASPRAPVRPPPDVPFYDVKLPTTVRSAGFGFRGKDITADKQFSPGPVYDYANDTIAKNQSLRATENHRRCTFGLSHKAHKEMDVPGPGAYGADVGSTFKGGRGALLASRVPLPAPKESPGPGHYERPSAFTPRQGACLVTLKGRLPHPMDDTQAAHEAAKTSCPRIGVRKMRAAPRLK